MKPQKRRVYAYFNNERYEVRLGIYPYHDHANGALMSSPHRSVKLFDEDGDPAGTLSINLPDIPQADNTVFIKAWGENKALAKSVLAAGLFKDTGESVPVGACGFQ